jgi:GR25 family glycosyltransferase involved in LPS biosynthesis
MLILEDDAIFHPTFSSSFAKMWKLVPEDWDIFYLGFCNVGPTTPVVIEQQEKHDDPRQEQQGQQGQQPDLRISIVRPSYGFYTHAYALRTNKAAQKLLSQLPVVGPIDTWLADNAWFGMNVYFGVMGRSTCIIGQQRKDLKNDIVHSAHCMGR